MPECVPRRPRARPASTANGSRCSPSPPTTPSRRRRERTKAIGKLTGQADKARPQIEASLRLAEEEQDHEGEARRFMALLAEITVPEEARRHGEALAAAQKELSEAQGASEAARDARLAAEAAFKGLPDLAELQGTQVAHESLRAVSPTSRRRRKRPRGRPTTRRQRSGRSPPRRPHWKPPRRTSRPWRSPTVPRISRSDWSSASRARSASRSSRPSPPTMRLRR